MASPEHIAAARAAVAAAGSPPRGHHWTCGADGKATATKTAGRFRGFPINRNGLGWSLTDEGSGVSVVTGATMPRLRAAAAYVSKPAVRAALDGKPMALIDQLAKATDRPVASHQRGYEMASKKRNPRKATTKKATKARAPTKAKLTKLVREARAAAKKERSEAATLEKIATEVAALKATGEADKKRKTSKRKAKSPRPAARTGLALMGENLSERDAFPVDTCPRCGGNALGGRFRYAHLATCPYRARAKLGRRSVYR